MVDFVKEYVKCIDTFEKFCHFIISSILELGTWCIVTGPCLLCKHRKWVLVRALVAALLIQLLADVLGETMEDGLSSWAAAAAYGRTERNSWLQLQPGPFFTLMVM